MKFAITPCPNDTFSYEALISKRLPSNLEFVFDDIEALNLAAESAVYPITKLSFPAYLKNSHNYDLLDAGAALGIGTGPVLVKQAGEKFDPAAPIVVPGANTMGALLLRYWLGKDTIEVPVHFRKIIESIVSGEFGAGVLIHEGRFVFSQCGLELVKDLGAHWTESSGGLPVPLGCICVRKDLAADKGLIESLIRQSIDAAFANPSQALPYVKSMAQYLEDDVLEKHIYAFVNEYSKDISPIREKLLANLAKC